MTEHAFLGDVRRMELTERELSLAEVGWESGGGAAEMQIFLIMNVCREKLPLFPISCVFNSRANPSIYMGFACAADGLSG